MFSVTRETTNDIWQEIGEISCLDEAVELCEELSEKYPNQIIIVYEVDLYEGYNKIYAMHGGKVAY